MSRTRAALAVVAFVLTSLAHPATADSLCPADSMRLSTGAIFTSTAASFDTTSNSFGTFHVAYDLTAGSVHMDQCCSLAGAWIKVADRYDVVGVPAGTLVSVTAQLTVDGSVSTTGCGGSGCGGYYGARIEHGSDAPQVVHAVSLFSGSVSFHDVVPLTFAIVAGTPELVFLTEWGARSPGGSHASEATGVLTFTGLPIGVSVVSCQGFGQPPVPVREASWGRLKTIYR